MTKEELKKAADGLRKFADALETNEPSQCTHHSLYHHVSIPGFRYGEFDTEPKYMGVTWIFTTYPRPVDSDKVRAVIEGRL